MIIKGKISWIRFIFHFKGSSFEKIWPRILIVTVVAIIVMYIDLHYNLQGYTLTITPFTLIGVTLSIFLGFRNNAAYDTPILVTYNVLIRRILLLIAFFGLDAIGDEMESPFGKQSNNLPLMAISRNIEINLLELINNPD